MTRPVAMTSSPASGLNLSRWKVLRQITASIAGLVVLQREVAMAARVLALEARDLAAQPHEPERVLDRPLEREGKLGDGVFDEIAGGRGFCSIRPWSCIIRFRLGALPRAKEHRS